MCEFLKTFDFSDLVAIGSVILLYLTFERQGKSFQLQKDLAEAEHENFILQKELAILERNAKRAEYLPHFKCTLKRVLPSSSDGAGGYIVDLSKDEVSKFEITIDVLENPLQIYKVEFTNSQNKYIQSEISHYSFFKKTISTPGTPIRLIHAVNFKRLFEDVGDEMLSDRINSLTIKSRIFFMDMLGNKYSIDIFVKGLGNDVDMRDIEIIEEEKPAN